MVDSLALKHSYEIGIMAMINIHVQCTYFGFCTNHIAYIVVTFNSLLIYMIIMTMLTHMIFVIQVFSCSVNSIRVAVSLPTEHRPCDVADCDQTCHTDPDTLKAVCGCQNGFELDVADGKTCIGMLGWSTDNSVF